MVSADAVRFGNGQELPLRYERHRDAAGNPGLIVDREGVVSQFIYVANERALYFYPQGLGVPGTAQRFHRCASRSR